MEPIGAAASIIAVLELSDKVLSYIRSARGATKDRKRLRDEVQACDDILQQLRDDADDSSEPTTWSEKIAALEKPGGPLSRLLVTLTMLGSKLEDCSKSGSRFSEVVASLKWPFDAKEVDKLLVALEREKTLLGLALTIETQKLLQKIEETSVKNSQDLKELLQSLEDTSRSWEGHFLQLEIGLDTITRSQVIQEERGNNRTILDWLSPLDFTSQKNGFIGRRQAGTGLWLLRSEEYQHWVTTAKETLFCPGMPGAGKTILASIVIEDLYERYRSQSNIGIAYLYCNLRRQETQQETQTIEDLFSSLLKQLAGFKSSIPKAVRDLFHRHQRPQSRPALQEILATLKSVLGGFKRSFIVVDALDECQDYDNCRSELIKQIYSIQTEIALNFFATSRKLPDIMEKFDGVQKKEIRASEADIGRYLTGKMPRLPRCVQRSTSLQEEIVTEITKSADGMFLLAQLHMDSLVDATTIRAVRTVLQRLDSGSNAYGSAYDDAMARINGQSKNRKELALRVLMWITCAKWQLNIRELQHALAVQIHASLLDEDDFVDIHDIISVCAGLVTMDGQSNIVRLAHYTTQEYFQRQEIQDKWFPTAEDTMFMVCTTYLGFEEFAEGACEGNSEYRERLNKHPFYPYAACNWARELRPGSLDWDSVAFLKNKNMTVSSLQAAVRRQPMRFSMIMSMLRRPRQQESPRYKDLTAMHLAAHNGINELVSFLDASHINDVDFWNMTPLHYAAGNGHVKTVQLLLDKGADTEVLDADGQSALGNAAKTGTPEIVQMLLDAGADPNLHERGQSPLRAATGNGHSEVVQLLIDHKANIDARDQSGRTPLMLAAQWGRVEALQTLLKNGADIEARDETGCTAITRAIDFCRRESLRSLLDYGANIRAKNNSGETPLSITQEPGYKDAETARMILEKAQESCHR